MRRAAVLFALLACCTMTAQGKKADPLSLTAKTLKVGAVGIFGERHTDPKTGAKGWARYQFKLVEVKGADEMLLHRREQKGIEYEVLVQGTDTARWKKKDRGDSVHLTRTYEVTRKEKAGKLWRLTVEERAEKK